MKERIHKLILSEQLTSSKFADKIGVQRSSISHIISGRNNPSMDFIQKVLKTFPHVNADWLLLGKGDMYSTVTQPTIFEVSKNNKDEDANEKEAVTHDKKDIEQQEIKNISSPEVTGPDSSKDKSKILDSEEGKQKVDAEKREIHKIVIFYKDRTFVEYYPE